MAPQPEEEILLLKVSSPSRNFQGPAAHANQTFGNENEDGELEERPTRMPEGSGFGPLASKAMEDLEESQESHMSEPHRIKASGIPVVSVHGGIKHYDSKRSASQEQSLRASQRVSAEFGNGEE